VRTGERGLANKRCIHQECKIQPLLRAQLKGTATSMSKDKIGIAIVKLPKFTV